MAASAEAVDLQVTGFQHRGHRQCMEDYFSMKFQKNKDGRDHVYACFGVYAGHRGKEAAEYTKANLINAITKSPKFWSGEDSQVMTAIREGYTSVQQVMYKEMWQHWKRGAQDEPSTAGTTATICFVMRGKLFIANVGNSEIVLASSIPQEPTKWEAKRLTKIHSPNDHVEVARMHSAGGKVVDYNGMSRVVWNKPTIDANSGQKQYKEIPFLNMSRSLGDFWSYNPLSGKFIVSPNPDVYVYTLNMTHDRCIILASDGLWNKVAPQSAVQIVKSTHAGNAQKHSTWVNPSKNLCDESLQQGRLLRERNDNITVITVLTHRVVGEIPKLQDKQPKGEDVGEETRCRITI